MPVIPLTEEQILAANLGEPEILNKTISLVAYDPDWPLKFDILAGLIKEALGDDALLLEHVGSTAVPGLSAKPVIDMVLAVEDSSNERTYVARLEEKGFTLKVREPDWYEHRFFNPSETRGNLHVFSSGCEEIERMLLFRDRLRTNIDDRQLYEETKRELASRTWKYMQNYADAKTAVVSEILTRAQGGIC